MKNGFRDCPARLNESIRDLEKKAEGFELFNTGIWISTKCNSKKKRDNIYRLMNILGIKEDEIEFYEN